MLLCVSVQYSRNARVDCQQAAISLGYDQLKPQQLNALLEFLGGQDVFVVLPTGYGKSLIYACMPYVFDAILGTHNCSVVVITPLTAIMKDQVASLSKRGISCAFVTAECEKEVMHKVKNHEFQLIFFTPEMLLLKRRWRSMLRDAEWCVKLKAIFIDEAHCVKKWGETFRECLLRIGELRSLIPKGINMMSMTATATQSLHTSISSVLGMHNPVIIAVSPCKANIMYAVENYESLDQTIGPFVTRLQSKRTTMPRMIIYCRLYCDCADVYLYFYQKFGVQFTEPVGAPDVSKFRLVDMFTSVTNPPVKDSIISSFQRTDSHLRVVISTVAFGMGVDCPNVHQVVHLGPPDDTESYIQETGQAGRDGRASLALLYYASRQEEKS